MDYVPLIDAIGEPATLALVGSLLGFIFGIAAQRSAYCTRSAVIAITERTLAPAIPVWLTGFAVALFGTQALSASGLVDLFGNRFFDVPQNLTAALAGGTLFGVGMVLARGCASRLLVLAASGNGRALAASALVGVVAWATISGPLVPLRTALYATLPPVMLENTILASAAGNPAMVGLAASGLLGAAAILLALRQGLSAASLAWPASIGFAIAGGWYATYSLSGQLFDPIATESLTYLRPAATSIEALASGASPGYLGLDTGIIAGTLAGAFLAAIASGQFRIAGFREPSAAHPARYVAGAVLMGFGGVLAGGCTIGAGLSGGSALAVSALAALGAMAAGAALAHLALETRGKQVAAEPRIVTVPAE